MRIISFAWTTPALLAGQKTVTRRSWDPGYAGSFREGEVIQAYDRLPRVGGKRVATIQLTCRPYFSDELPATDWYLEGFAYLEERGHRVNGQSPSQLWASWAANPVPLWIVRFRVLEELPLKNTPAQGRE